MHWIAAILTVGFILIIYEVAYRSMAGQDIDNGT
jgi:hypothetical protein